MLNSQGGVHSSLLLEMKSDRLWRIDFCNGILQDFIVLILTLSQKSFNSLQIILLNAFGIDFYAFKSSQEPWRAYRVIQ